MSFKRGRIAKKFALAGLADILLFVIALLLVSIFSLMSFSMAYLIGISVWVLGFFTVVIYKKRTKKAN